jgi:hypothetical protein
MSKLSELLLYALRGPQLKIGSCPSIPPETSSACGVPVLWIQEQNQDASPRFRAAVEIFTHYVKNPLDISLRQAYLL